MALENAKVSQQKRHVVTVTTLQSAFERLASMRRGQQPKIVSATTAKNTSSETKNEIIDHAVQAVAAQANISLERAIALLDQTEG